MFSFFLSKRSKRFNMTSHGVRVHRRSTVIAERLPEQNPFRFRANNTQQLSPLIIREWIDICEDTHGGPCSPSKLPTSGHHRPRELLLIDTAQARLVRVRSNIRYCTLSYVWGKVPVLKTTGANLSRLQQTGAFNDSDVTLPKVVEDSIAIVLAIGERYLWVDSLCTVQDDPIEKHRNIMNMDSIYRGSVLTIIALSGEDANTPLPGIRPHSRSSQPARGFETVMTASKYETRGWTFQERLLSRRCAYFSSTQIYLECSKGIRTETGGPVVFERSTVSVNQPDAMRSNPLNEISNAAKWLPDLYLFKKYCSLVEVYMSRELSYPEDILKAFSGILSDFERRSRIPFVCGLPEIPFERALLWAPLERLERRQAQQGNPIFPTWSWVGWVGKVKWLDVAISYKAIGQVSTGLIPLVPHGFKVCSEGIEHQIGQTVRKRGPLFPRRQTTRVHANQGWSSANLTDPTANVLEFTTLAVSASQFSFKCISGIDLAWATLTKFTKCQIIDPNGRLCGTLYGDVPDVSDSDQLVLLSWSPARMVDAHWSYFGDNRDNYCEGGLFNAMLIRWNGQFAERLAVAQVHANAFGKAGASAKRVLLV